jgi:transcriptional regulator with XRE-family HTH domain
MSAADAAFGTHLRTWRTARQLSQEALAGRAGVSPRHLSFVENGRSQPSRELVLALAGALDVPLRDRNTLLAAAGFAAVYRASPLDGDELRYLRRRSIASSPSRSRTARSCSIAPGTCCASTRARRA